MHIQALFKSALWVATACMLHRSAAPPYKKVSDRDARLDEGWWVTALVRSGVPINLVTTWLMTLGEVLIIHSSCFRDMISFPADKPFATVDASFMMAFTIIAVSFHLRLCCFRRLGEFFTPWVMVRPDHKLVTDGPYAFVRHPSYTGIVGTVIGNVLLHFSGTDSGVVKFVFWIWFLQLCIACAQIIPRSNREDALLLKTFGMEWEVYRKQVPYRFVPWIF